MGTIGNALPAEWSTSALIVGAVVAVVSMAAMATAAHALPAARQPDSADGDTLAAPGTDNPIRRRLSVLLDRLRPGQSAPIPAAQVATWCDALSRRLRAGDALRTALVAEQPDHRALLTRTEPLRRALGHGVAVADAVGALPGDASQTARRDPHLELLCSVIAATADFGGSAAAPIDRVGATLRLRSADGQERDAQSAQARLSAHVLTVVPLGLLALLAGTDGAVREFTTGGLGLAVIGSGLALNLSGWWWMKHVVTGDAS